MAKRKTPSFHHLISRKEVVGNPYYERDYVYEPSEDSFLMIDAIESIEIDFNPTIYIDVGSGSGLISCFVSNILGDACACFAIDHNIHACHSTIHTAIENNVRLHVLRSDLFSPLLTRLEHSVDFITFNPPYVESDSLFQPLDLLHCDDSSMIDSAWNGGQRGREVIDRFLPQAERLLSPTGILLLLVEEVNDVEDISLSARTNFGLVCHKVLSRRAANENLCVLQFSRGNGI